MSRGQAWLILAAISLIVMRVADDDNGTWIMGAVLYTWAWGAFWWDWMEQRDRRRA